MDAPKDLPTLRERLRARLRKVIDKPEVEAKELAAFDLLMSRRDFLKHTNFAAMGALVAAGTPPTMWGRRDPELAIAPSEVGLTAAEMASVATVAGVTVGTELFQETIYAEPAVSPGNTLLHALLEGPQQRPKLQSQFEDEDPLEATFLDTGYHYGQPELVQLEEVDDGVWQLVHYHHPWGARDDGRQTDGLVGQVLMDKTDGLSKPGHVLTVTAPDTNAIDSSGSSQATYLVLVHDGDAPGGLWVLWGRGTFDVAHPGSVPDGEYPVEWTILTGEDVGLSNGLTIDRFTTLTDLGFQDVDGSKPPAAPTEYAVVYREDGAYLLTVNEFPTLGIQVIHIPFPDGNTDWALGTFTLNLLAWIQNTGSDLSEFQTMVTTSTPIVTQKTLPGPGILLQTASFKDATWAQFGGSSVPNIPEGLPSLASLSEAQLLYTASDEDGTKYLVHLGRFDTMVALYTIAQFSDGAPSTVKASFAGMFPLVGTYQAAPSSLSGGVSKFGGYRFVVTDDNGNLFVTRQRRLSPKAADATPPYLPPIYGPYDDTGQVVPPRSYSNTSLKPPPDMSTNVAGAVEAWAQSSSPKAVGVDQFSPTNILMAASAAFAIDDVNLSWGTWLGEGFQAAYAPSRFAWDSSHVAITRAQTADLEDDETFAAYLMACNPVTKAWHRRLIAQQVTPTSPELTESGDHYQATLALVNAYDKTVPPSSNADFAIEVRGDVPTTVTDTTHNLYYDVDRYSSFVVPPSTSNGKLELAVKADALGQMLYVRLVDTSTLRPSDQDSAMLTSSEPAAWTTVNIAAQAQQRMGNDGGTPPDDYPLKDSAPYVTADTLSNPGGAASWNYKAGFSTSGTLNDNLSSFLKSSGKNLIASANQVGLSAQTDVDPLTSGVSMDKASMLQSETNTTAFTYAHGSTTANLDYLPGAGPIGAPRRGRPAMTPGGKSPGSGRPDQPGRPGRPGRPDQPGRQDGPGRPIFDTELGSIWSGISHALHDALHWLQHAADDTVKALGSATVTIVMAADGIEATIDQEIMKAVNGVEQAVSQTLSTVEEYASVLANVIVTIVEASFIYKMIAEIIALISMFLHFHKMVELRDSLQDTVLDILQGNNDWTTPAVPSTFSAWDHMEGILGVAQDYPSTGSTQNQVVANFIDDIVNNPLTKKIVNLLTNAISKVVEDATAELPVEFDVDALTSGLDPNWFTDASVAFEGGFADAIIDLVTDLVDALAEPVQFYNIVTGEGGFDTVLKQVSDAIEQPLDALDQAVLPGADGRPAYGDALAALLGPDGDKLVTVNLTVLADLFRLFGLGSGSGKVTLSAGDILLLPVAMGLWVDVYMRTGKVISDVGGLVTGSSSPAGPPAAPGVSEAGTLRWDLARISLDFALSELTAIAWDITATIQRDEGATPTSAQKTFLTIAGSFTYMRRINDYAFTYGSKQPANPLAVYYMDWQFIAAACNLAGSLSGVRGFKEGGGSIVSLLNIAQIVWEAEALKNADPAPSAEAYEAYVGRVIYRIQQMARTLWSYSPSTFASAFEVFEVVIFGTPFGRIVEAIAVEAHGKPLPPS